MPPCAFQILFVDPPLGEDAQVGPWLGDIFISYLAESMIPQ